MPSPEVLKKGPSATGKIRYNLMFGEAEAGHLDVYPLEQGWELYDIFVVRKESGWGSMLLNRFLDEVGAGVHVEGPIGHTQSKLMLLGRYQDVIVSERHVEVHEPSVINNLPIVQFLNYNRVQVNRLSLHYFSENHPDLRFLFRFYGRTT